jgi:DMSO/TMAO reductase YedYZ molybdopterin-dependent catalytic subunit
VTHRRAVASGVLAAVAALAASQGLAALAGLRESLVLAVAQTVIALTPGAVAEPIIRAVGHADKPLAVASVVVAVLALGALVGRWWLTRRPAALLAVVALVAAASAAVLTRPYASATGVLVCVVSGLVVVAVMALLLREPTDADADASRRAFLRTAGLLVLASAFVGGAGEVLAARRRRREQVEQARAALRLPTRPATGPPGADLGLGGQPPWLTPTRDFYRIDTALQPPLIDPGEWSLRVHGLVERELTLTYQDLLDRGLTEEWVTMLCVSNPVGGDLIGNTRWGGVPMAGILADAGVLPGADALLSTSEDGWTCGTPLEALTDGRAAMLALTMNGEALPIIHGFPVRQVVPGLYGYVSATKWVVDWEVTRFADVEAYWTQRGWAERGPVKTGTRIDLPASSTTVPAGTVTVAGVSWHQRVGIRGVEVRVDGGAWRPATLATTPNDDTWVQWRLDWDASPGTHRLEARATDGAGDPQTADVADVLPDGATGYAAAEITVA